MQTPMKTTKHNIIVEERQGKTGNERREVSQVRDSRQSVVGVPHRCDTNSNDFFTAFSKPLFFKYFPFC